MRSNLLKGSLLLIVAMFNQESLMAQMYVSPNSYVFVNNEQLFVKGDLELNSATSNLYLRSEGQLLQGSTVAGTNKGIGDLSVYQEGTSNNFGYNQWCSPVGVPAAGAGNNTFGIGQLKRPSTVTGFGGESITTGFDGSSTNSTLVISNRWIYKFVNSNQYANWVYVGSANTLLPGEGFTMKGVSGSDNTTVLAVQNNPGNNQRYDFRGKPNDGTIDITVGSTPGPDYPNRTLTGNPYPSAININLFLLENSGYTINYGTGAYVLSAVPKINGNAYYWEHAKTANSHTLSQYVAGYGTYSPNGATAFSPGTYVNATWNTYNGDGTPNTSGPILPGAERFKRMFAPIGQGFQVQGSVNGTVQMKNLYRVFVKEGVASNSTFDRTASGGSANWPEIQNVAGVDYTKYSKAEVPQIRIHTVLNNEFTRETALAFNPNATDGYDVALDAVASEGSLPNDTFFPLNDGTQYVISTMPFAIDKRIPFAFKSNAQTTFRITVGELINFDMAENVYIHDKQTGEYFDIKNNFFEISLPAGSNKDRFEITFQNERLSSNDAAFADNFIVYQNNESHNLTIGNPKQLELKSCTVYDITGKQVFTKANLGSNTEYTFPTSSLSDGVYIVRVNAKDNQEFGKKVIVKK